MERLLSAAERLIGRQGFDRTRLNSICAEAELTTGAFYARFSRKEDLALPLWERIEPEAAAAVDRFAETLKQDSLEDALRVLIADVTTVYEQRGVLLRELTLLAPRNPELAASMRRSNERVLRRLVELVLSSSGPRITHPKPGLAVTLAFICILNTLRELVLDRVLFETYDSLSPDTLARELSRLFINHLGF